MIALGLLLAGGGAYALLRMGSEDTPSQPTSQTETENRQTAEPACGDGKSGYDNPTYGISFCYPESWGTVSIADSRFAPQDTGSRYELSFSDKLAVKIGLVSDDWTTEVGRGGGCADPSMDVPEGAPFAEEWSKQLDDSGTLMYASRGLSTGSSRYVIQESVDDYVGGVCTRAYANLDGTAYKLATASYYVGFSERVSTPQLHVSDPTVLFTVIERQLFTDFVRTIQ